MTQTAPDAAPTALGPYSLSRVHGDLIFTAGQIGLDPDDASSAPEAGAQIARVLDNIEAIVVEAGGDRTSILRLTVYLTDLSVWPTVNTVMEARFSEPYPARTAIGVAALPFGAIVEMDAVAVVRRT